MDCVRDGGREAERVHVRRGVALAVEEPVGVPGDPDNDWESEAVPEPALTVAGLVALTVPVGVTLEVTENDAGPLHECLADTVWDVVGVALRRTETVGVADIAGDQEPESDKDAVRDAAAVQVAVGVPKLLHVAEAIGERVRERLLLGVGDGAVREELSRRRAVVVGLGLRVSEKDAEVVEVVVCGCVVVVEAEAEDVTVGTGVGLGVGDGGETVIDADPVLRALAVLEAEWGDREGLEVAERVRVSDAVGGGVGV